MSTMYWVSLILVVVGALNWGLVGLFQFDLVAALLGGPQATPSRVVYTLVGLAAVTLLAVRAQSEAPRVATAPRPV